MIFHDRIKAFTRGYGSMTTTHRLPGIGHGQARQLVNGEPVDAFSCIVHPTSEGRTALAAKLKESFAPAICRRIQAAIGGKVVARETVGALRR